jgi:hypothetical protein
MARRLRLASLSPRAPKSLIKISIAGMVSFGMKLEYFPSFCTAASSDSSISIEV